MCYIIFYSSQSSITSAAKIRDPCKQTSRVEIQLSLLIVNDISGIISRTSRTAHALCVDETRVIEKRDSTCGKTLFTFEKCLERSLAKYGKILDEQLINHAAGTQIPSSIAE
jgi:hypothetical protein